ncbi:helix-hairpin-helix repeat-containing competence protein ComEA [Pseudomonas sp. M47T1]|uniref:ComEA family DNA-binding protein n=1 Tax=Pseudomonas sp. M47T1 TaxID=1179778 RepID=UPI0002607DCC|nr:helix-hairpin-helix domain-containing protein [Pseudomonas sp. M47T1]EIK95614.1 helix-hairpin-helix repeat-containing competence protein ComEA [Pseudomonas sp. M47T1]
MRTFSLPALLATLLFTLSLAANAAPIPNSPPMAAVAQSAQVNLNKADAETLQRDLAGIGTAKAQAIVAHRESNGAFTSVDELLEVKGIGKSLLDKNRDRLTLE